MDGSSTTITIAVAANIAIAIAAPLPLPRVHLFGIELWEDSGSQSREKEETIAARRARKEWPSAEQVAYSTVCSRPSRVSSSEQIL